jgi:bifunctional DNase/RNase
MIQVFVKEIFFDATNQAYILILQDESKEWTLPVWVGPFEAQAISMGLARSHPDRPQTHDLFISLLGSINVKLLSAVINRLEGETYYATLHLLSDNAEFSIDSRPSDAVAIAIRGQVPIFVKEGILKKTPPHMDFSQLMDKTDDPEKPNP